MDGTTQNSLPCGTSCLWPEARSCAGCSEVRGVGIGQALIQEFSMAASLDQALQVAVRSGIGMLREEAVAAVALPPDALGMCPECGRIGDHQPRCPEVSR